MEQELSDTFSGPHASESGPHAAPVDKRESLEGGSNGQITASRSRLMQADIDFDMITCTIIYRYMHLVRIPLFFSGVAAQVALLLLNVFHNPINIVGIICMSFTIWIFMFPIFRESNQHLNSHKKRKKNGNLLLEFAKYTGSHSYRIAVVLSLISMLQYIFNISGTKRLKNHLEQDILHSTLSLKNFGISNLENAYPTENILLAVLSMVLFHVPKGLFHLKNTIDDENFNDDFSKMYLDIVLYLNMIMPYATSFLFAFVACIQPGLIGSLYLIVSLYWLFLVYFSNTSVKIVTRIQLFLCCVSPLILFSVYRQFPSLV